MGGGGTSEFEHVRNGGGGGASGPAWDERCLIIRYISGRQSIVRFINRATASGALRRIIDAPSDVRSIGFDWDITADESFHLIRLTTVEEVILPPLPKKAP